MEKLKYFNFISIVLGVFLFGIFVLPQKLNAALQLSDSLHLESMDNKPVFVSHDIEDKALLLAAISSKSNSFHLISHGQPGKLLLNNKWHNVEEIVSWFKANDYLQNKKQLNIYGCNFAKGEKGKAAVSYLEAALGVSVAASDDITGKDGDWDLEVGASHQVLKVNYAYNLQDDCLCGVNSPFNGDFEDGPTPNTFIITNASNVPDWETSATDNNIEIWASGFNGVQSQSGNYHAEINANQNSALYQRICTKPGSVIIWSVWHRGRAGTDVATVRIGGDLNSAPIQATMTTSNVDWVQYSGTYTVPNNQNFTLLILEAVSTAGSISVGNFVDNIEITEISPGPELSVVTGVDQTICDEQDFTIGASATGGVAPYDYTWDNGLGNGRFRIVSPTTTTTYTVTVTDANGCTDTDSITIGVNPNSDPTFLTSESCDSTEVGVVETLLQNAGGCDSLVITTITLLSSNTTELSATTCDSTEVGVVETLLQNADGCDSLVITTTTLLLSNTTE